MDVARGLLEEGERGGEEEPSPWKRAAVVSAWFAVGSVPCLLISVILAALAAESGGLWRTGRLDSPDWTPTHMLHVVAFLFAALVVPVGASVVLALRLRNRRLRASAKQRSESAADDSLAVRPVTDVDCPFCKATVDARAPEGSVRCPSCETLHHADCWRENSGCTIFACTRAPRGRDERAPVKG